MSQKKEIRVPDIGDFDKVPIIEVLVAEGDEIEKEQSLITLESDKAAMEVPAPVAGKLVELRVKEGDEVSEGDVIAVVEVAGEDDEAAEDSGDDEDKGEGKDKEKNDEAGEKDTGDDEDKGEGKDDKKDSEVDEKDTEADDKDTEDDEDDDKDAEDDDRDGKRHADASGKKEGAEGERKTDAPSESGDEDLPVPPVPFGDMGEDPSKIPHATPSVRKLARELGVDLKAVEGSGRKGRITEADLKDYVRRTMESGAAAAPVAGGGLAVADAPKMDFSKFGEIEEEKLSRIKRISGPNLHRNWVTIPHVTQFDEADITDMEAFRKASQPEAEKADTRMTPLVFLIKACVAALKQFPDFNASLAPDGETLIRKKYFHVGVAVDTPGGLMVPVLRDCDRKGLIELARELTELSGKAREGKLSRDQMQGGCFTISSLGGIGGTAFTPIINAPELAILGVSRAETRPRWNGGEFEPRLMLPLSLSYDHRVIDGADAARFTRYLATQLEDLRRLLL